MLDVPEHLSDAAMWALIIGFLSPVVLQFLIQSKWRPWVQSVAAFAWSAIAGVGTAWLTGAFTGLGAVSTVLLVFVVAISTYQGFWKKLVSKPGETPADEPTPVDLPDVE